MIWLIGSGSMAISYTQVLKAKNLKYTVIGRSKESADNFREKTGDNVITGGIDSYIEKKPEVPTEAIISVGVGELFNTAVILLKFGVKKILLEKPGALEKKQIDTLNHLAIEMKAKLFIAYNRRFFSSTKKVQELVAREGGVKSFNFELTEWADDISQLPQSTEVLEKWFLANTTHVVDLAFFLGGKPKEIKSFTSGKLSWHPSASIFSGAGITDIGAVFNYGANWESAGRWSVEILTNKNRYILRPMEKLIVQKRGEISCSEVELADGLDIDFKPGLYNQITAFLGEDYKNLCSIEEQAELFTTYECMASYSS